MTDFGVETLPRRFPALNLGHDGRPMAFFDWPSGAQAPKPVIDGFGGMAAPAPASRTPATV